MTELAVINVAKVDERGMIMVFNPCLYTPGIWQDEGHPAATLMWLRMSDFSALIVGHVTLLFLLSILCSITISVKSSNNQRRRHPENRLHACCPLVHWLGNYSKTTVLCHCTNNDKSWPALQIGDNCKKGGKCLPTVSLSALAQYPEKGNNCPPSGLGASF